MTRLGGGRKPAILARPQPRLPEGDWAEYNSTFAGAASRAVEWADLIQPIFYVRGRILIGRNRRAGPGRGAGTAGAAGRGARSRPGAPGSVPDSVGERILATTADWQATVQRTVDGLGYELVELERAGGGLLRVTIDRVPGRAYPGGEGAAVTLDDCELVTRQLQVVLHVADVDYGRLEVSSPGLDRPLKRPADYARFAGARITLALKQPLNGRRNFRGQLQAAPTGWRLVLEDDNGVPGDQALDFALDEVREARLVPVIDFKGRGAKAAGQQGDRSQ